MFYLHGPIDNFTHVSGPVAKHSTESEYNVSCNVVMSLLYLRMLNNELLNKYPDVVPEQALIIVLDRKSSICMDNTGKDTKHTRHITRRTHFVTCSNPICPL